MSQNINAREDVVIVGAARTPQGKLCGGLAKATAVQLGATAIKGALEQGQIDPDTVEMVFMGNVLQAGLGQDPARQAAIAARLPWSAHAVTINSVCLSGMSSIIQAARAIRLGDAKVVVAGGMESMTGAPHLLPNSRFGQTYGPIEMVDSMANDGLSDAWSHESMGLDTEERIATYPVTREQQDELAAKSQQRAAAAWQDGVFADEIVPVVIPNRKGDVTVDTDEGIRGETTIESLGKLRPAFTPDGTITAGNASPITDGAAALVLTSRANAEEHGWHVLATVRAQGEVAGPDPSLAPQPGNAIEAALKRQGWSAADLDLVEINEAFAAVGVSAIEQLGLDPEKVNVHGGAIALGHPLGASGARLVVHLAHELHRRGQGKAAAALCGGTGQGTALLLEA